MTLYSYKIGNYKWNKIEINFTTRMNNSHDSHRIFRNISFNNIEILKIEILLLKIVLHIRT